MFIATLMIHSSTVHDPSMRKRDYNIMCRERREMSQNDIDAVENMPDEDPPTPTETILDP